MACLNGGSSQVVTIALVALTSERLIECGETIVQELWPTGFKCPTNPKRRDIFALGLVVRARELGVSEQALEGLHPVEKAVYEAVAATPATAGNVVAIRRLAADAAAVENVQAQLARRGLLVPEPKYARSKRSWALQRVTVAGAVCLIGAWGAVALGSWMVAVPPIGLLPLLFAFSVPRRTSRGEALRKRAQLVANAYPDKLDVRMVLASLGAEHLWEYNRPLAIALAVDYPPASG